MRLILAAVLSALAVGASAQSTGQRPSTEPVASPFTYEVLGATPSLRLKKTAEPRIATPATATAEQRSASTPASRTSAAESTDEAAATERRNRMARGATK